MPPGTRASDLKTSFSRLPTLKMSGAVNSSCCAMKVIFARTGALQESQVIRTLSPDLYLLQLRLRDEEAHIDVGGRQDLDAPASAAGAYSPSRK